MSSVECGDYVEFSGADSYYKGYVVCVFEKTNGKVRCVVEDDRGLLLIKNPQDAKLAVLPELSAYLIVQKEHLFSSANALYKYSSGTDIIIVGLKYLAQYLIVKAVDYTFELSRELFLKKLKEFFGEHLPPDDQPTDDQINLLYDFKNTPLKISIRPEASIVEGGNALFAVQCTNPNFEWLADKVSTILIEKLKDIPEIAVYRVKIKSDAIPNNFVEVK